MPNLERGLGCTVSRGIHDTFLSAVSFSPFNCLYVQFRLFGRRTNWETLFFFYFVNEGETAVIFNFIFLIVVFIGNKNMHRGKIHFNCILKYMLGGKHFQ